MEEKFIKQLENQLDTKITHSKEPIDFENTYVTDSEGEIVGLRLMELPIKNLGILFPIASHLIELSLVECDIADLRGIEEFVQLEFLDLSLNAISNVRGIEKLGRLRRLVLAGTEINSNSKFEEFYELNSLEYLDLDYTRITSIAGLQRLPQLQKLVIGSTKVRDFSDVPEMPMLRVLDLNCCHEINFSTMHSLQIIPNLAELNLTSTMLTDLRCLDNLTSL